MSEAAASTPAEGTGASTPSEGAASQIIESGAVDTATPQAAETPAPDRSEHNKWLIAQERERRRLAKEREQIEAAKREAEAAREEAKRLSSERNSEADQMAALLRSAKGNPAKFNELLEASGLTMDDYVRWRVSDGEVTPEQQIKSLDAALRDELKSAREEIASIKKEREEERAAQQRQAKAQKRAEAEAYFHGEIKKVLDANPDQYELTIAAGDEGEVFDLIDRAYNERGIEIPVQKAAEMVEKFHRDRAERFVKTKFYSSKYAPPSQAAPDPKAATKAPPTAKPTDAKRPASPAALTNQTVTSPVTPADEPAPTLSREEFIEQVAKQKVAAARKAKESSTARK